MSPEQLSSKRKRRLPLRSLCARRGALSNGHRRASIRHPAKKRAHGGHPTPAAHSVAAAGAAPSTTTGADRRHAPGEGSQDRYQSADTLHAELDALRRGTRSTGPRAKVREGARSIAVLPFDIIGSADEKTVALRDGLAAEIGSRLSRLEHLRVAPRTSIRALEGHAVREIGRL